MPAAALILTEGTTFMICDATGDIGGSGVEGVFVADTRICNRLVLTLDGARIEGLSASQPEPFHAAVVGRTVGDALLVFRDHWVGRGLRADLRLRNLTGEACIVDVCYEVGSDLAGLFEVKEGRVAGGQAPVTLSDGPPASVVCLGSPGSARSAAVRTTPPAQAAPDGTLRWKVDLAANAEWEACLEVQAGRGGQVVAAQFACGADPASAVPSVRLASWLEALPRLDTDVAQLAEAVTRSACDLGALRIFDPEHPEDPVLAAGAPWFMSLFGRDSIIASWMALVLDPRLALSTVRTLARLQGRTTDAATEEQPGRILHEVRMGSSASLALGAGDLYYGTADATPLFVMLVAELRRWGAPFAELRPLTGAVDAALDWVAGPGDPDGDGYVEYERFSASGLVNQGWKDSWDGVAFANGELAAAPIAMAEVQAYAYAAWLGGAELASAAGDDALAASRRARAAALRERFNRDFWLPGPEAYALALDADKRPVDAIASNMGHCLWAGIVEPTRVAAVAAHLCSPEMFSGWGVRTLATSMARYDPLSYHNGSVWPHDTAICMAGLRRAGRPAEALRIGCALLDASAAMGGEMPELFSGIDVDEAPAPVAYPASCRPQAWAAGAPLLVLRALLGLEPDVPAGRIGLDPLLPPGARRIHLTGMPLAGATVDI